MLKIDLHMHTGDDPYDGLPYSATALIDRAAAEGFGAIAITLHDKVLDDPRLAAYARDRGLLLVPAVEWNIEEADVLLYNVSQAEVDPLTSFEALRSFRARRGEDLLVVAPHPFYPMRHALRDRLEPHLDLFDAVEYSHVHLPWLNFNHRARQFAARHGKPIVANSDSHNLWMFGRAYSLVDAAPEPVSIFRAIRAGRLQWHSPHFTVVECLRFYLWEPLFGRNPRGRITPSFQEA